MKVQRFLWLFVCAFAFSNALAEMCECCWGGRRVDALYEYRTLDEAFENLRRRDHLVEITEAIILMGEEGLGALVVSSNKSQHRDRRIHLYTYRESLHRKLIEYSGYKVRIWGDLSGIWAGNPETSQLFMEADGFALIECGDSGNSEELEP
ncbi:MAG: hypothetical protein Q7P63_02230 [Verrucomicrobiota bacterium JB022]|nr:hypothetical protein [Verrucomicrobiota bacterium JB022]